MAITYDNSVKGRLTGGSITLPTFTVGSNPNSAILFATYQQNTLTTPVNTVQLDGVTMAGVTSNSGPAASFGSLNVWFASNVAAGSRTISFSTGFDATLISYVIYSYYNVLGVDQAGSAQGSYSSSFNISEVLTASVDNALVWMVGGAHDGTGNNPSIGGYTGNLQQWALPTMIGAGDFGTQLTPSAKTGVIGANPGIGQGAVALVSLSPVLPPATTTPGSFLLNFA